MTGFYNSISAQTLEDSRANEASNQATNAAASATAAANSLAAFNSTWKGILTTAPTTGLVTGSLYYDTTLELLRFYNGSAWVTAPQGPTGPQGIQGVPGNTGPTGNTGPAGQNGTNGATGPQGSTGATGPQGPTGQQGPQGTTGSTGSTGPGFSGGTYSSSTGVVTFTSADGIGFSTGDLRGADGTNGATGPTGPQGNQGPAGSLTLNSGTTVATLTADNLDTTTIFKIPVTTTGNRPTGATGRLIYNQTLDRFEGYGNSWVSLEGASADELARITALEDESLLNLGIV